MAKTTSVALGDHFAAFIEHQISAGRYGNASEMVRAGLRLLEEREAKLEALRAAIEEGLESGPAVAFDVEELLKEVEAERSDT